MGYQEYFVVVANAIGVFGLLRAWRRPDKRNPWIDPLWKLDELESLRKRLIVSRWILICWAFFMAGVHIGSQSLPSLFHIGLWSFFALNYGVMRVSVNRLEDLRVQLDRKSLV